MTTTLPKPFDYQIAEKIYVPAGGGRRRRITQLTMTHTSGPKKQSIRLTIPGYYRKTNRLNKTPTQAETERVFAAAVFALVEQMGSNPETAESCQEALRDMGLPRTQPLISCELH